MTEPPGKLPKKRGCRTQCTACKSKRQNFLEDFSKALEDGKVHSLNLILKGDVAGAVEALEDAIFKIEVDESVQPRVLHRAVGSISESDVNLATVDNAIIIGFNVRPDAKARDRARHEESTSAFILLFMMLFKILKSPSRVCWLPNM